MNFYIMTLFPELIHAISSSSILGRAEKDHYIHVEAVNIRDYSHDKHLSVDDYPYGGGKGMLMQAAPVVECYEALQKKIGRKTKVIYLSPGGKTFTQKMAEDFSKEEDLIFLCGHYEGIDERALQMIVTDEISIGDYVLTGGEIPAMVLVDAIARNVPGVLSPGSTAVESFQNHLLEHPQYTRPEEFRGKKVPAILLSGDHQKVARYEHEESLRRTFERRPDLLEGLELSKEDRAFLEKLKGERETS